MNPRLHNETLESEVTKPMEAMELSLNIIRPEQNESKRIYWTVNKSR
jgi:hypothetical protein